MPVELHQNQQEAVDRLENGRILIGGMGSGKSITAMAYFVSKVCKGTYNDPGSMRTPKDVYVITTAKKRDSADWDKEALGFGICRDPEFSRSNVKLTVDSWNNLAKYTEVKDAFFIFDEQRVVGYGAWSRAFIKIAKSNEWILLSATPGDTWMDYIPVFIANGWYRNKTDFIDQHVIWTPRVKYPKVQRYQNVGVLVRRRNEVLVPMPSVRHTTWHRHDIICDYDEVAFKKVTEKRWHVFEKRPLRDVAELFSVMRKVVNSDRTRLSAVSELMSKHPRLIVFYNFDYELEMLRTLGESSQKESSSSSKTPADGLSPSSTTTTTSDTKPSPSGSAPTISPSVRSTSSSSFAIAEWNGHKHEEIPATERWLYLVQYRAGAEGWNCITTDAICFYSQTYSYRDWWQAHGRIDRLNTPFTNLHYYYLISRSVIDKAIRKALRTKKNFNEKDLKFAA